MQNVSKDVVVLGRAAWIYEAFCVCSTSFHYGKSLAEPSDIIPEKALLSMVHPVKILLHKRISMYLWCTRPHIK